MSASDSTACARRRSDSTACARRRSESTACPRSLRARDSPLPISRVVALLLLFDGAHCSLRISSPVELNGTAHFYDTVGTTGEKDWFVNFYAPWCGHCKALEADWTTLASQLHGSSTGVARVDATAQVELAALYQVEGFPSLQLFSGGRVFSYAGERNLPAMLAFAQGGFKGDALNAQPMPSRPSLLDPLLRLPRGVADVLEVAALTRPLAGALLAAGLFALGVLTAMACRRPEFIMVRAPPGASAGQHFAIELPGRWRSRRMTVAAPPGVVAGQPFFVPLTKPLVARQRGVEEKKVL